MAFDTSFEDSVSAIGVTDLNRYHNLFEYSAISLQSLDFAASAAGQLDAEAARFLRMAHGMMRFRVDKILEMSLFDPPRDGQSFGVAKLPYRLRSFYITAGAAAAAMAPENADPVLQSLDIALDPMGSPQAIEGHLVYGLAVIALSEREIVNAKPESLVITVDQEQADTVAMLQTAAASIRDLILQALKIIKDKIVGRPSLYVCENCGLQFAVSPDEEFECPLCKARRGLICARPFEPGPEMVERYRQAVKS